MAYNIEEDLKEEIEFDYNERDSDDFVQDDSESFDYDADQASAQWGSLDFAELVTEVVNQLEGGKKKGFSKTKKVVDGDQISSLARFILEKYPSELNEARGIIAQRDAIIANAKAEAAEKQSLGDRYVQVATKTVEEKKSEAIEIIQKATAAKEAIINEGGARAEQIIRDAKEEAERRVEIDAITVQAKARASEIIESANETAQTINFRASKEASELLKRTRLDCDNQRATAANAMRHANMVLSQSLDEFISFSLNKAETLKGFSRDVGAVMTNLADNIDANVNYAEEQN